MSPILFVPPCGRWRVKSYTNYISMFDAKENMAIKCDYNGSSCIFAVKHCNVRFQLPQCKCAFHITVNNKE